MSRFSGLPEPRQNSEPENRTRIARIRAATAGGSHGRRFDELLSKGSSSRLAAHQQSKGTVVGSASARRLAADPPKSMHAAKPVSAAPKATAASTKPKPEIIIPADVAALGSVAVAAYKVGYARTVARLAQLSKHPAVAGRSAEAISLVKQGMSNAEIIAHLTKDQRAQAADAVWTKAIAAVYGNKQSTSEATSETVWNRAIAKVHGTGAADAPAQSSRSTDIWDRAYASLSKNGAQ